MLVSQVLIVFSTIKDNPGLNLEELANKISSEHIDLPAAKYLSYGQRSYELLKSRIQELGCIEEIEGRYRFNPDSKVYSIDPLLNAYVKQLIDSRASKKIEVSGD